ncbi:TetR/AcrR family transcriptional regulator [Streptomyces sp. LN549]|uniref:TetR/AcrR family transcriptional regulator n=1 Tax=Streptomyces sp. LN549 TaxID=3112979 RepID=UPI00371E550B
MVGTQSDGAARGPGRPREERVTGAVLRAVVDMVHEQGIAAVTMDAVAARAGVSKPAIYRRWPTKQDLIIAAAETRIGILSVPDLGDFRAELHFVLTARLEAYRLPGTDRLIAGLIGAAAENGAVRGVAGVCRHVCSSSGRLPRAVGTAERLRRRVPVGGASLRRPMWLTC